MEQFSGYGLLSDQDSDPESDQISDEEYIPDTESDEDDDTSVQDVPMDPSAAVASELGDSNPSEEKPEAEAGRHGQEVTSLNMTKKNYCYVCEKSNKRKILLEKIRNKGNFQHNMAVLQAGEGSLKVKRQPKANIKEGKFIHCMYCQDELAASDAEASDGSDSEASDTENLPTECGTSEPEPAEVVPVLSSTGSEPAPPSEVKTGSERPAVPGKPSMSSRRASVKTGSDCPAVPGKPSMSSRRASVKTGSDCPAVPGKPSMSSRRASGKDSGKEHGSWRKAKHVGFPRNESLKNNQMLVANEITMEEGEKITAGARSEHSKVVQAMSMSTTPCVRDDGTARVNISPARNRNLNGPRRARTYSE
ncbi:unnamed protein product [Arctogadus glacialis]